MRGLKYGFQGVVNAKNVRENSFLLSDEGLACSDRGAISPSGANPASIHSNFTDF